MLEITMFAGYRSVIRLWGLGTVCICILGRFVAETTKILQV